MNDPNQPLVMGFDLGCPTTGSDINETRRMLRLQAATMLACARMQRGDMKAFDSIEEVLREAYRAVYAVYPRHDDEVDPIL